MLACTSFAVLCSQKMNSTTFCRFPSCAHQCNKLKSFMNVPASVVETTRSSVDDVVRYDELQPSSSQQYVIECQLSETKKDDLEIIVNLDIYKHINNSSIVSPTINCYDMFPTSVFL